MYKYLVIFTIFLFVIMNTYVYAAPREGATNQTQVLIQQLGSERTRLSAENAKLKNKLKKVESELEKLKKNEEKSDKKVNSLQTQLSEKTNFSQKLTERLDNAKIKLEELIAKFRETITNLRQVENENALKVQEIAELSRELNACATNNVALSTIGFEVLEKYEDKGFWDNLGQNEPFAKIKKVQIENLVDEYKYLIEDQEYLLPEHQKESSHLK